MTSVLEQKLLVIAGKTEAYFCAIAHLEDRGYVPTEHERSFARYGDEATLFRLAGQLEKARPWFDRKPPVAA
mgnify:CR=1 FL=1